MQDQIFIGSVPPGAQVKISIRLNLQRSKRIIHAFSYQLCYDGIDIGEQLDFSFKIGPVAIYEEFKHEEELPIEQDRNLNI